MTTAAIPPSPDARSPQPRKDPLDTFGDFLPWILYWVLVGNVPFRTSPHVGGADALWPSDVMARLVVERREAAGITGDEVSVHPGAGHLLRWPVVPVRPAQLAGLVFGGGPEGQAAAHASLAGSILAALGAHPWVGTSVTAG